MPLDDETVADQIIEQREHDGMILAGITLTEHRLKQLLEQAASAHHDATGGDDDAWPAWYAHYIMEHMFDV